MSTGSPTCARLSGKVALVTGGGSGIGAAVCRRLATEGAAVVVSDVSRDAAERVAGEICESGWSAYAATLDISDAEAWSEVVATVTERHGRLDVLVNNAGIGARTTVEDETDETWDRVISVSQRGTWYGMRAAGPVIARGGGGSIINLSSIFGTVGGFGSHFSYHAAKGAVRTMSKNAALYWASSAVRVNSVHPGFIRPDAGSERGRTAEHVAEMIGGTPLGRLGESDEVAAAIAFLASDDSTFVTGSELYVDGGWTAR